jgi:ABC-type multidrug transport system fused ATPase/permease subunit
MIRKILDLISKKDRNKIFLIIVGLLLISLLEMLSIGSIPVFVYLFLDIDQFKDFFLGFNLDASFIAKKNKAELLKYASMVLILIFVIKNIFIVVFNYFHYNFNFEIKKNLCLKIFSKYINEDYETLKLKSNSTITRDILIETSQFIDIIDNLISLSREILLLLGIIFILIIADPVITFITGTLLGFIIISFYFIFRKKISEKGKIVQFERERLFQWINQTFGSILDIKIFNQHSYFYKLFSNSVIKYEKQNFYMNFVSSLPKTFLEVISISIILLLIIIHIYLDKTLVSFLPLLSLLVVALVKMIPSFNNLIISFNTIKFRRPSLDLIHANLNKSNKNYKEIKLKKNNLVISNNISFEGVSYKYPDKKKNVFENINLKIKKDEFTAIIGKSGSGKSTLMLLMLGVLNPSSGKILLDDNLLDYHNFDLWHKNISYVSQNPYLLNDTISNNIIFGRNDDEIIDYKFLNEICEISKVNDFSSKFEKGLETKISDNGSNLSGGQKQRISIARALYRKSNFVFFDEATNALDEILEKEIFDSISKKFPNITKIVITHRLSSIKGADNIIYYENDTFKQTNNIEIIKSKLIDVR